MPDSEQPLLYKYCDTHGFNAIEDLLLKVTPPNQFNDIFEVTPRPSEESFSRPILDSLLKSERGQSSLRRAKTPISIDALYDLVAPKIPDVKSNLCRKLANELSKHYGLLCLAGNPRHLLMWSHYTDRHRGLVISLDAGSSFGGTKERVKYVRERIEMNPPWLGSDRETMRALFTSKCDQWSYEGERRIIFSLSELERATLKDGSDGYFCRIPPSAIVEVIVGFRASDNNVARLFRALDKHSLHVPVWRATPHPEKFSIELNEQPPING